MGGGGGGGAYSGHGSPENMEKNRCSETHSGAFYAHTCSIP